MKLQVTAWPRIHGKKRKPGELVEVDDPGLAKMLIREGQAREAGTPEPLAAGRAASERTARVDAGLPPAPPEPTGPEPAAEPDAPAADADPPQDGPPPKPGRGGTLAEWVAYAIGQGMDHEDAKSKTRAQLASHYAGA